MQVQKISFPNYKTLTNAIVPKQNSCTFGRGGYFVDGDLDAYLDAERDFAFDMERRMNATRTPSYKWSKSALNIHNIYDDDTRMRSLAEYFSDRSDENIREICDEAYWTSGGAREYAERLLPYIHEVQRHKKSVSDRIKFLEQKATIGVSNIATQKDDIKKTIFEYMKIPEEKLSGLDNNYPIPNGILLFGKAPDSDKDDFATWILNFAPNDSVICKEINFDMSDKINSFKKLVNEVKGYEELHHKLLGKRTILKINGIEALLNVQETREDRRVQSAFKNFIEHCAKDYHTTLLVTGRKKELTDFEPSAVPPHRFRAVYLETGITPEELEELSKLKAEIKRLKDKENSAWSNFTK